MSEKNNIREECPLQNKEIKTSIGGQALLEGIMMRGPKVTAMSVRTLKGEIVTEKWPTVQKTPAKVWKWPLFRGLYGMASSLKIGYKCLMRSAELSGIDELAEEEERERKLKKLNKKRAKEGLEPLSCLPEEESAKSSDAPEHSASAAESVSEAKEAALEGAGETFPNSENLNAVLETEASSGSEGDLNTIIATEGDPVTEEEETTAPEKSDQKKGTNGLVAGAAALGSVLGIVLAIFLFIWLPTTLYSHTLKGVVEGGIAASYPRMLVRSLFEGVLRIAIFVAYMAAVSLMKDIRRTFMYHGAEHKTIFCYEKGLPLTVENVRKMQRFHPRCGTSFMIVMLILGIILGSFIPSFTFGSEALNNLLRSVCKLALLPVTVGLGYEFIKYAGRHNNRIVRILSAPGLWMQRISTKEPDDSMIECAITAVKEVIPEDGSDRL